MTLLNLIRRDRIECEIMMSRVVTCLRFVLLLRIDVTRDVFCTKS